MFDTEGTTWEREPETRRRLLDAAGEVFSERGFREATIRDICTRAGANVAAINYHFRDKENLYLEVLRYADHCASIAPIAQTSASGEARDAGARLAMFVRAKLCGLSGAGRPAWHSRLIMREMMEPTPALDSIVNENIRPQSEMLSAIVRELLGPSASEERVVRCKFSIIGQCLIYHSGRHVLERLHPEYAAGDARVEAIVRHITEFSLAALAKLRSEAEMARGETKEPRA